MSFSCLPSLFYWSSISLSDENESSLNGSLQSGLLLLAEAALLQVEKLQSLMFSSYLMSFSNFVCSNSFSWTVEKLLAFAI